MQNTTVTPGTKFTVPISNMPTVYTIFDVAGDEVLVTWLDNQLSVKYPLTEAREYLATGQWVIVNS